MIHTFRNFKVIIRSLVILLLIASCGSGGDTAKLPGTRQAEGEPVAGREASTLVDDVQPGIHESTGFFPVYLDEVPLRFMVIGDMGSPVLYSSTTLPAWLAGTSAYLIDSDGHLVAVALDGDTSQYLPPDLAVSAYNDPSSEYRHFPVSICVTGPASAVFFLEDNRLLRSIDGYTTVLRQFETGFTGRVVVAGSPGTILMSDSYGRILALDGQTAETLWDSLGGPVLLSGGMALFVGQDSHLQIHEALDGKLLASSDLAGFSASIKPTKDATRIFSVQEDGRLVALDKAGKTIWVAETGIQALSIMNDLKQVHLVSPDVIVAFDKATGSELWRLSLPVPPAGDPVMLPGSIVFAGTDGKVYASVPDPEPPAPQAAYPGERISAVVGFRLEKYVRNRTELLAVFLPFVDQAVHEGFHAFSVFDYGPVKTGGEYWFTWEGEDRDVVLALFNERGDELRANLDEFGAHDSFSYRLDERGRYFIALGRQDPSPDDEPLFLSVIPVRRD